MITTLNLPDDVHLGRSLKCSWTNWFIDLEGARSNLVRILRDPGSLDIRRKLRKCLTLDCVRNKDRMAFEPIVRLTMHAVGLDGGLYVCNPFSLEVDLLLQNHSESCKEIKRLCKFEDGITFTDSGDRKVKFFRPSEKNVKTLMCSGQEGASDGTDETCSFTQVHGICSMEKTLFVSDVATGCIKLASRLSGIVSFIKVHTSLQDAVDKVSYVTTSQRPFLR